MEKKQIGIALSSVFFGVGLFSLLANSFAGVPHGAEHYGASVLFIIAGGSMLMGTLEHQEAGNKG